MRALPPRPRSGFTFVELLAVTAISLFLFTIFVFAAEKAGEADSRKKCAGNMKMIGQALILYANENKGAFPRVRFDIKSTDKPAFFTAANVKNPFDKDGPVNDVTAAMYLLLRTQDIKPEVFVCPSTPAKPLALAQGKTIQDFSNFPDNASLSYSLQNCYPSMAAVSQGYKWNFMLPGEFAVAADINPGAEILLKLTKASPPAELARGNSPNHGGEGQNVLYADGHVEFASNPFCGMRRDNIYTFGESTNDSGGKGIQGPPEHATDSILLPTAQDGAPAKK